MVLKLLMGRGGQRWGSAGTIYNVENYESGWEIYNPRKIIDARDTSIMFQRLSIASGNDADEHHRHNP
jgi:hypothetical protein